MTTAQRKRQRREYRKFAQELLELLPERAAVWFRQARNG